MRYTKFENDNSFYSLFQVIYVTRIEAYFRYFWEQVENE